MKNLERKICSVFFILHKSYHFFRIFSTNPSAFAEQRAESTLCAPMGAKFSLKP